MPAIDFSTFDEAVRVQDDLFRHVNGRWLAETEIPADKPLTGSFMQLRDDAEAAVRDIITGIEPGEPGTEPAKIADLYASFMDTDRIESAGAEPIRPLLARVDAVERPADLIRLLGIHLREGIAGLIDVDAESDPGDPNRYVMFVGQGGIGLPDEEYYRLDGYAAIRDEYRKHVSASLALAGLPDPDAQADAVFALESAIAARHWDKVKTRDMRAMYNLQTLAEFEAASAGLEFRTFLAGAGIEEQTMAELVVAQPSFFAEVAELLTDDRVESWKSWARWKIVTSLSPYLRSAFVDERFRFYGTVLSGTPELRERWKRGVALVEGALGEAVGKVYVERHFSPVAKERMDTLVANLIEAYRRSITELDWMTDETKASALDKLAKFRPHIGYPAKWRDYSSLAIHADDLIGNVLRTAAFELNRSIDKIGAPIDRDEWLMTPQTVNAYYHPLKNEIVFPAAILQPPFFNERADDAVNYGGIGAVIGHEIGHGFDDQGSTCDGDGRLRDWWTGEDRAAFEQRTTALIEQYSRLSPEGADGERVNGELTIGENIGDLGGLTIALLAYTIARGDSETPALDGYTDVQRLFLNWGAIWQQKSRPEMVKQRLATDPHSPPEFRCNQIVRNVPEFYTAFDVQPSDALWLAAEERVKIW
ncbi:M13 family metallopeptidase [Microlunatus ginsengisoli]|uniref:M13 family metallopeptidase n=1 Tax=Microlunatus ginsengisoli TaxID=363863 RepID=A0ABP6ZML4_9ACTN